MHREEVAGTVDTFHDTFGKFTGVKASTHAFGEVLPESFAAMRVNANVADHRELARAWREINQHAIAFPGLGHAEPIELLLRRGHGIGDLSLPTDKNSQLTGCFLF